MRFFLLLIIVLFSSCFSASRTTKIHFTQSVEDSVLYFKADTSKRAFAIVGEVYGHKVAVLEDTFSYKDRSIILSTYFTTDSAYVAIDGDNLTSYDQPCDNPIIIQQVIKFYVNGQKTKEYVYDPPTIKIQLSNNKVIRVNLFNVISIGVIEGDNKFVWRVWGGRVMYPDFHKLYDMDGKQLYSKLCYKYDDFYDWRIIRHMVKNYGMTGFFSCTPDNYMDIPYSWHILYDLSNCPDYGY